MGYYVNPPDTTKEDWLNSRGELLPGAPATHRDGDRVAVCLVDNGWMTAAGIAYDTDELAVFADPHDLRSKKWYWININDLRPYVRADLIKGD